MTTWLHIGLQKTGTTSLQQDFFPRLDGLVYLGGKGARLGTAARDEMRRLIVGLKSVAHRADVVAGMADHFRAFAARWNPAGLPGLISEEGFSDSLPGSRFDRLDVLPAALRLVLGTDTRIAVVVREPIALLISIYEQRLATLDRNLVQRMYRQDGPPMFDAFILREHERHRAGAFDTVFDALLRFDRVVEAYGRAFGSDRVHVLPFDPLRTAPDDFCRAWCRLLAVPDQVTALPRRNASGPARRRHILDRFGIDHDDPRAVAFQAQFAALAQRLRSDPLLSEYAERHCAPVCARAASTYAALTGAPPSVT